MKKKSFKLEKEKALIVIVADRPFLDVVVVSS